MKNYEKRRCSYLFPAVEFENADTDAVNLILRHVKYPVPWRVVREGYLQLTCRQVDTRTTYCLRLVTHEHITPETVIHVVPERIKEILSSIVVKVILFKLF